MTQILRKYYAIWKFLCVQTILSKFLSEESQGLNVLIEYLNSRLVVMRHKLAAEKSADNFSKDSKSSDP